MAKKTGWNTDLMPEKIIALATFHGELLNKLGNDPKMVSRINQAGAQLVAKYFDAYVDHIARIDPYRYHHIYEFGGVGSSSSRLFKSTVSNGVISYSFIESSVPNNNGDIFSKKAFVMESGNPITITPKNSTKLVFEVNGETVFANSSYIQNPGGPYVAGAFKALFDEFFNSKLPNKALKELGFYDEIVKGIKQETKVIMPRISSGSVKGSAQKAAAAAYGIVKRVESNADRL